jgi:hypothetical protein
MATPLPDMRKDRDYVRWTDKSGQIHQSKGILSGTASLAIYRSRIANNARKVTLHIFGRHTAYRTYNQPITL